MYSTPAQAHRPEGRIKAWAARSSGRNLGVERPDRWQYQPQIPITWVIRRLEPRALHHGRRAVPEAVKEAFTCACAGRRPDLPWQAPGQLDLRCTRRSPTSKWKTTTRKASCGTLVPLARRCKTAENCNDLIVATTRPETMLGDACVAVNPNDELPGADRQIRRTAIGRPPHPDYRRRLLRPGVRHRLRENHPGLISTTTKSASATTCRC